VEGEEEAFHLGELKLGVAAPTGPSLPAKAAGGPEIDRLLSNKVDGKAYSGSPRVQVDEIASTQKLSLGYRLRCGQTYNNRCYYAKR
jgi:hypothetical protein